MQFGLCESMASLSSYAFSVSCGIPSIGYLSRKGVKWVGLKMLDAIAKVERCRQQRLIFELVKWIRNLPVDQHTEWMAKNLPQMNRTIEDILELSSYVA